MALPTGKQTTDFEAIEPGNYEATLLRASLSVEKEYQSDAFNDGDGLKYQAINFVWKVHDEKPDGTEWTEKFVKVSLHENSKLYNRLSALLGRKITETDVVSWDVDENAERDHAIDTYYKAKEDDEDGNKAGDWVQKDYAYEGIVGAVHGISIDGVELIGATCMLELEVNKSGYNRAKAGAATQLPKRGRGRKAEDSPEPEPVEPDLTTYESEQEAVEASAPARGRGRTASKPAEDAAPTRGRGRRQPPTGAPR